MSDNPIAFQYSLRRMLCVVLTTGILFGLSFKMHSGGFTPSQHHAEMYRAESAPKGMHLFGYFGMYGYPFSNYEIGATWVLEDYEHTTREHQRFVVLGAVCNLAFWFMFSCVLWFVIGRVLRWKKSKP